MLERERESGLSEEESGELKGILKRLEIFRDMTVGG